MIIEILDNKTIEEIGKEFSAYYPFLKIELYNEPHQWQEATSPGHMIPHHKKIGEVRKRHNPGSPGFHSQLKVL
jgi:hypothetical protein